MGWSPLPALDSPAVPQSANLGHSNPSCSSLRPLGPLPPGRVVHSGENLKPKTLNLFLQAGQLVWSGLEPEATRLLVHYLTTSLLPSLTSLPAPSPTAPHQGRFLVGGRDSTALPTVHLKGEQLHLLVYHAINSTMLLLLSSPPSPLLYR